MANPHKRQRANSYEKYFTSHWASDDLAYRLDLIRCIDKVHAADEGAYIKNMLLQLALSQPGVANSLRGMEATLPVQQTPEYVQAATNKFNQHVRDVEFAVMEEHSHISEWKQHDRAYMVCSDVVSAINSISREACAQHIPWAMKQSALDSLIQIGRIICSGTDTMGHEVRKHFQSNPILEDSISEIVKTLTVEERGRLCQAPGGSMSIRDWMKNLIDLSADFVLFTNLQDVIELLSDIPRTEITVGTRE
ncbi:hypothetical protein B5807_11684 [Epicoccum nigrum]|jgi:hypothetical protein|uniref:Uncharacterized protein n=1 Tax=Epicoccum nigrum TaxID=105696 RepID=A0A1Y2LIT2_EPING|nr:hypothetical protein B5807_11684 [Epicoccum nigrum]